VDVTRLLGSRDCAVDPDFYTSGTRLKYYDARNEGAGRLRRVLSAAAAHRAAAPLHDLLGSNCEAYGVGTVGDVVAVAVPAVS
jgi:hypothetical protein